MLECAIPSLCYMLGMGFVDGVLGIDTDPLSSLFRRLLAHALRTPYLAVLGNISETARKRISRVDQLNAPYEGVPFLIRKYENSENEIRKHA